MQSHHKADIVKNAAGLIFFLFLSACYEEDDQILPSAAPVEATSDENAHWLGVTDTRAPDAFLAEQSGLAPDVLEPRLKALSDYYRESPRMIANRVLQLWQEYPETPLDKLMADLVPERAMADRSLGPVAQQYRTLRKGGAGHDEAIAKVMEVNE